MYPIALSGQLCCSIKQMSWYIYRTMWCNNGQYRNSILSITSYYVHPPNILYTSHQTFRSYPIILIKLLILDLDSFSPNHLVGGTFVQLEVFILIFAFKPAVLNIYSLLYEDYCLFFSCDGGAT